MPIPANYYYDNEITCFHNIFNQSFRNNICSMLYMCLITFLFYFLCHIYLCLEHKYMHMALFGVRYGFFSAQVSESSPSLKGEVWIRTRVPKKNHHARRQTMLYAFSRTPVNIKYAQLNFHENVNYIPTQFMTRGVTYTEIRFSWYCPHHWRRLLKCENHDSSSRLTGMFFKHLNIILLNNSLCNIGQHINIITYSLMQRQIANIIIDIRIYFPGRHRARKVYYRTP